MNAIRNADRSCEVPKKWLNTDSRTKPRTREHIVREATNLAEATKRPGFGIAGTISCVVTDRKEKEDKKAQDSRRLRSFPDKHRASSRSTRPLGSHRLESPIL
ncbi:MAG: hypothetical protein ACE5HE_13745 [Phycisphaerae bacterium]